MIDLGLESAVKFHADKALITYGLGRVETGRFLTRYESAIALVQYTFDGTRSYELDIYLGRLRMGRYDPTPLFSLAEVLRWRNRPEATEVSGLSVTAELDLFHWVGTLTRLLVAHADTLLRGDENAFSSLMAFRRHEITAYEKTWSAKSRLE